MTFRDCAKIANCSTGAIGAEMRALKAENIAKEKKRIEEEALLPKLELEKLIFKFEPMRTLNL